MRSPLNGLTLLRLIATLALIGAGLSSIAQEQQQATVERVNENAFTDRIQEAVVFSARVGQIDANASIYRSYTNSELSSRLNEFHTLSPQHRRELLLEVNRRIRVEGGFVVEKEKQHFGKVVGRPENGNSTTDSPGLQIEEVLVARISSEQEQASDEELERQRRENATKQQPPVVRVINSGRAYSQ